MRARSRLGSFRSRQGLDHVFGDVQIIVGVDHRIPGEQAVQNQISRYQGEAIKRGLAGTTISVVSMSKRPVKRTNMALAGRFAEP